MTAATRHKSQMLSLYRMLMREAKKFPTYNFRMYTLRKIKDEFQANKSLEKPDEILRKVNTAKSSLELIRRQVIIGHLYACDKLAIEIQK